MGRYQLEMTVRGFERTMAARTAHLNVCFLDIAHAPRAHPVAIIAQICARADVNCDEVAMVLLRKRLAGYRRRFDVT